MRGMITRFRRTGAALLLVAAVGATAGLASTLAATGAEAGTRATLTCPKPYTPKKMVIGGYEALVCAGKKVSAAKPATPANSIPGNGTFLVGSRVRPGTYESAKPKSGNCYWARLKDTSGGLGSIIANNNSSGPSTVTIDSTDRAFQTSGCETWVKVA